MPARKARAAAQAAPQISDAAADKPEDMDALRHALARRISQLIGDRLHRWRSCRERACKRARGCRAPRGSCSNGKQRTKPVNPEQSACALAQFQRMVRERIAQMDAELENK